MLTEPFAPLQLRKLEVKDGDVVFVHFPYEANLEQIHRWTEHVRAQVKAAQLEHVTFVIMPEAFTIEHLNAEAMAAAGWTKTGA